MFVLLPTTGKQVNYHPFGVDYFDTLCTPPPPRHLVRVQILTQQLCNVAEFPVAFLECLCCWSE